MAIKLGNTNINVFGNNWIKAYLGNTLVLGGVVTEFISLWETTTANETITLPINAGNTWDWGDGTVNQENSHEYTDAGQYTIKTSDSVVGVVFGNTGDKAKILNISSWGGFNLEPAAFYGCNNLDITAVDGLVLVDNLSDVFRSCSSLVWNNSVGNLDITNVTNITRMFSGASVFNQNIDSWSVGHLTGLSQVLSGASSFNQPLNSWDTSSATDISLLFNGASSFNQPLNNWDTSLVENMRWVFRFAYDFNQDISAWSFVNVTNMTLFMLGKGSEYDATYMDNLYIKLDQDLVFANMVDVNINFGSINYTSNGAAARASLVSKGFIISSGGQV